jgi:hypothetical protein
MSNSYSFGVTFSAWVMLLLIIVMLTVYANGADFYGPYPANNEVGIGFQDGPWAYQLVGASVWYNSTINAICNVSFIYNNSGIRVHGDVWGTVSQVNGCDQTESDDLFRRIRTSQYDYLAGGTVWFTKYSGHSDWTLNFIEFYSYCGYTIFLGFNTGTNAYSFGSPTSSTALGYVQGYWDLDLVWPGGQSIITQLAFAQTAPTQSIQC